MQVVHEAQQTSKIRQIASFYSELLYLPSCGHIVATYQLKWKTSLLIYYHYQLS